MTLFIYDQIWDDLGIPDSVQALKSSADVALPVSASCNLEQVEEISKLTAQHEAVHAFGGGSVLDKVKLAIWNEDENIRPYVSRGRAGIATIPQGNRSGVTLIPTTLGTGSEANVNAVLQVGPHRRRLVMRRHAEAFEYRHFPSVYARLSRQRVLHGVLEIVLRTAGIASVANAEDHKRFADMFSDATRYTRQVFGVEQAGEDQSLLASIAELSARTHQVQLQESHTVWVWPLWYLANELSSLADVTKLEASIALVNPVMSRIGEFGYGSKTALSRLEYDLGESLADFVTRIGGPLNAAATERMASVDREVLVQQTLSQWSGNMLPLGTASPAFLDAIFEEMASQYA